jgi:serum/glucocorticoid-regulated kinase 2
MKALSKSTQKDNMEFVVHVKDEYDYRFVCEQREELFE